MVRICVPERADLPEGMLGGNTFEQGEGIRRSELFRNAQTFMKTVRERNNRKNLVSIYPPSLRIMGQTTLDAILRTYNGICAFPIVVLPRYRDRNCAVNSQNENEGMSLPSQSARNSSVIWFSQVGSYSLQFNNLKIEQITPRSLGEV